MDSVANDIWVLAQRCFVDKNKVEFEIKQLSSEQGNNIERQEKLYEILNEFYNLN